MIVHNATYNITDFSDFAHHLAFQTGISQIGSVSNLKLQGGGGADIFFWIDYKELTSITRSCD
jgi:hypothetical protein